jgi:hypothetical protein
MRDEGSAEKESTMTKSKCGCGGGHDKGSCAACLSEQESYWCQTCNRPVPDKRCPFCGLKAQKRRSSGAADPGTKS